METHGADNRRHAKARTPACEESARVADRGQGARPGVTGPLRYRRARPMQQRCVMTAAPGQGRPLIRVCRRPWGSPCVNRRRTVGRQFTPYIGSFSTGTKPAAGPTMSATHPKVTDTRPCTHKPDRCPLRSKSDRLSSGSEMTRWAIRVASAFTASREKSGLCPKAPKKQEIKSQGARSVRAIRKPKTKVGSLEVTQLWYDERRALAPVDLNWGADARRETVRRKSAGRSAEYAVSMPSRPKPIFRCSRAR